MKITKQLNFEIEVVKTTKDIPTEHLEDFEKWLEGQICKCSCGKNSEVYFYGESIDSAIGISFTIKRL